MLAILDVGAVVGPGWLAAVFGSMAIGGVAGGLLGALTNAGIHEENAQVFVEGVRRGGTLVAAGAARHCLHWSLGVSLSIGDHGTARPEQCERRFWRASGRDQSDA